MRLDNYNVKPSEAFRQDKIAGDEGRRNQFAWRTSKNKYIVKHNCEYTDITSFTPTAKAMDKLHR